MKKDWLEKKYKVQLKKVGKRIGYQSRTIKYVHRRLLDPKEYVKPNRCIGKCKVFASWLNNDKLDKPVFYFYVVTIR